MPACSRTSESTFESRASHSRHFGAAHLVPGSSAQHYAGKHPVSYGRVGESLFGLRSTCWQNPPMPSAAPPPPTQARNPPHGVTLEAMVKAFQVAYGWDGWGVRIPIRCFNQELHVSSCVRFLRKNAVGARKSRGLVPVSAARASTPKPWQTHSTQRLNMPSVTQTAQIENRLTELEIKLGFQEDTWSNPTPSPCANKMALPCSRARCCSSVSKCLRVALARAVRRASCRRTTDSG